METNISFVLQEGEWKIKHGNEHSHLISNAA
jgi:hypothetical protein